MSFYYMMELLRSKCFMGLYFASNLEIPPGLKIQYQIYPAGGRNI